MFGIGKRVKKRKRARTFVLSFWMGRFFGRVCTLWVAFILMLMRLLAVDGADCNVVSDGGSVKVSLTTAEYVLQSCHWRNVKIEFRADGPFAVVLRNIVMDGGSIMINSASAAGGPDSTISVYDSSFVGCTECVSVHATTLVLSHVHLSVISSTLLATQSAASLKAPQRVEASSITVRDSRIEAQCSSQCDAASIDAIEAISVTIHSTSSNIVAKTTSGPSSSMGMASPTPLNLQSVSVNAEGCNVTATGTQPVACMGFAAAPYSNKGDSSIIATDVALHASGSKVSAVGSDCVACMGFASLSSLHVSSVNASNATVHASDCMLSAAGSSSVACMGFSAFGKTFENFVTTVTMGITNVVLYASGCNAIATGVDAVACVGIAAGWNGYGFSYSSIEPSNVSVCASRSSVTANGKSSVAAMGLALFGYRMSSTIATNISVSAVEWHSQRNGDLLQRLCAC